MGFLWFGKKETSKPAPDGLVRLENYCGKYEPVEAIIKMYNGNHPIQQTVNAFIDSEVHGYNRERIISLLKIYKDLKQKDEPHQARDVELAEPTVRHSDGTYEPYELSLPFKCQRYGVVEAIIECYHSNVSVDRTLNFLREAGIHSYTTARIKKLIKIYLDLKKKGESFNFTDIELLEGPVGGAKSAAKSGSRSSAKGREASAVDPDDDSEDFPEVDFDEPLPEYVDDSVKMNREEKKLIADALPIFSTLNAHVMVVGKGLSPALLVTGPGGIGKSFSVEKILSHFGKKNKDFVIMKGKCTPSAMFEFLFKNYDKICVFDDCDSVLSSKEGIAVLKGALDSGRSREISWNTKRADMVDTFDCETRKEVLARLKEWSKAHNGKAGVPNHFQFEGSVIFVSNMTRKELASKDSALLTRCDLVDIKVSRDEVLTRIRYLLPEIKIYDANGKNISKSGLKKDVFRWISSPTFLNDRRMRNKAIDFRVFIKAYKARYANMPNWKQMAFSN